MIVDDLGRIPMSPFLTATLTRAAEYAAHQSHPEVTLEHLLLALTEDPEASIVLKSSSVDIVRLSSDVSGYIGRIEDRLPDGRQAVALSADLRRILEAAAAAASQGRRREINGAIVLAAIVGDGKSPAAQMLRSQGMTFEEAIRALQRSSAPQPAPPPKTAPPPGPSAPPTAEDILSTARERVQSRTQESVLPSAPAPAAPIPAPVQNAPPEMTAPLPRPEPEDIPRPMAEPQPAPAASSTYEPPRTAPPAQPPAAAQTAPYGAPAEPFREAAPPALSKAPPAAASAPDRFQPTFGAGGPPQSDSPLQPQWAPAPLPQPHPTVVAAPPRPGPPPATPPMARTPYAPPPGVPPPQAGPAGYRPPPPPQTQQTQQPWSDLGAQRPQGRSGAPPPSDTPVRGGMPGMSAPGRARVEAGRLVENIPRKMRVAVPQLVEVRIAKESVKSLSEGLQGGGTAHPHRIMVTKAMSVRLRAPEGGFWIESASPDTQWIENMLGTMADDFASWRWTITPKERGKKRLQIIISARTMGDDGVVAETAFPDQVIEVKVATNVAQSAKRWGGWIAAAILGGVLAKFGEGVFDIGGTVISRLISG